MNEKELIFLALKGLPPTVNQMYRSFRNRRYKTQETRDFQDNLVRILKLLWGDKPCFTGRAGLRLSFSQKDKRRWDIDNRVKALQDCLQAAGVIKDDAQIDLLHLEREHGTQKTQTILTLTELLSIN